MSNLERDPVELLCRPEARTGRRCRCSTTAKCRSAGRAMPMRRTLPQRGRTTIGGASPTTTAPTTARRRRHGGAAAPAHGPADRELAVRGRDRAPRFRPAATNWSAWRREPDDRRARHLAPEVSTPVTTRLHGVQLWVALPEASRTSRRSSSTPTRRRSRSATRPCACSSASWRPRSARATDDASAPVTVFSPLLGAQVDLPAGGTVDLPSIRPSSTACSSTRARPTSRSRGRMARPRSAVARVSGARPRAAADPRRRRPGAGRAARRRAVRRGALM